jgi:hypothetical protein
MDSLKYGFAFFKEAIGPALTISFDVWVVEILTIMSA